MLKRIFCAVAAAMLLAPGVVRAQVDKKPAFEFAPHVFVQFQAGGGYVVPERGKFMALVTPMTSINAGYIINPVWGARLSVNYGRGKSSVPKEIKPSMAGAVYGYRTMGIFADGMFNLTNAKEGYQPRLVDFSLYLGAGIIDGLENYNAGYGSFSYLINLPDRWATGRVFAAGRGGVVMGVNISPEIQLTLDAGVTVSDDLLDSRIDRRPWFQGTGKLGFSYNFDPHVHDLIIIERQEFNKFSFVLLNLNFVDLGNLLTFNLGVDVGLSKHIALGVVGKFNPWVFNKQSDDPKFDNKTMAYLTAKYYPWNIFSGMHFDLMGGASGYTQRGDDGTVDKGDKIGGGIGAGYTYAIGKRLNLELAAGVWIGQKRYDTISGIRDGKVLSSSSKFFVEPYELRVGLSWVLNPDSHPSLKYKKKLTQNENEAQ